MKLSIIGTPLSLTSYSVASRQILDWATRQQARVVCAANVHMLMEAHDSPAYRAILNRADMVTPDGMPLVWMMRLKGARNQERVYGPTLTLHVLGLAAQKSIPVGFYGSESATLASLSTRMVQRFPGLRVVYAYSPPFRSLSSIEDDAVCAEIKASGARVLFVGLGCPRQEQWMDAHRQRLPLVMLGVGAAFDFHAGAKPQSPVWLQNLGLEWLYRLLHEPGRLWKRYFYHNPRFVFLAMLDLLGWYH